jgi:dTDP-4-amino-4,6-dideoxygalactose transaminase
MVKFNDLGKQWEEIRGKALSEIDKMGYRGDYIGGEEIQKFESEFSEFCGSSFSLGISNGTDALKIAFQMFDLGPNDLVIIPANTFIADYLAVRNIPLFYSMPPSIVLIDHDEYFNISTRDLEKFLLEEREKYSRVVLVAVHLYGHLCDLEEIKRIKEKYNLLVLEDCSQSHGSKGLRLNQGEIGEISVYSLYPGKNLGALGDAGVLTTNLEKYWERGKILRNYGSKVKYHHDDLGHNHRMDTIQAIILNLKLPLLDAWNESKQGIAKRYLSEIKNSSVKLPKTAPWCSYHSYHIFCLEVDDRDSFMKHMQEKNIPCLIHYPVPIYRTPIFSERVYTLELTEEKCERIVSIPIHPYLTETEIDLIVSAINSWEAK